MTVVRAVALGALALAIVVVAFILLRSGDGTEYTLRFQNAGQLVKDDDVQIGGRRIGSVRAIELSDDNQADITIRVEEEFTPLRRGTKATIRAASLSGIANRYISLTPGPNDAEALRDGARLPAEDTTAIVDLDQLFDTLDDRTRKGLQEVIRGSARQYDGKTLDGRRQVADEVNRSVRYLSPFLSSTDRLVGELLRDQPTLQRFLVDSSRVVSAVAARRDDLSSLVANANTTAGAIASESSALEQTLQGLPTTLRKANTTFVNLRSTLDDLDVLVDESKPATRRLEPFLRVLRPLVRDAQPTIRDLRRLIREPGQANDAIELLQRTPKLARLSGKVFPRTRTALRDSQEVVTFIRPYAPDLVGWLRDFGQGASNYDANGHFARISPMFNAFSFADNPLGGLLTPLSPALRSLGLQTGVDQRCPGAATQPRPDGSNPFRDDGRLEAPTPGNANDCDPTQVPPGP